MDKYFLTFPNGEKKLKTQEFLKEYKHQTLYKHTNTIEYSFEFDTKRDINIQIIEFLIIFETLKIYWKNLGFHTLFILDYFPYGRADKETSKDKGLNGDINFSKVIWKMFESYSVKFNTIHNPESINCEHSYKYEINEQYASELLVRYIESFIRCEGFKDKNNLIVFPDKGALQRFTPMIEIGKKDSKEKDIWENVEIVSLSKTRNTEDGSLKFDGNITSTLDETLDDLSKYDNIMVIDDILSKGGTFLAVNKILKEKNADMTTYHVFYDENSKPTDYPLEVFKIN